MARARSSPAGSKASASAATDDRPDRDARITRAFLLTSAARRTGMNCDASRRFLETQPARYPGQAEPDARRNAWADFCQMLLASNAFLYVE